MDSAGSSSMRRQLRVVGSAVDIVSCARNPADFIGFGLNWRL